MTDILSQADNLQIFYFCVFSAEGNELFSAINSSVLPILMATIHTLNHCLHYFNINPLSNTLLIQWHTVNQMHTIITALRLYWSSSNILFKSTEFMASFRVNLQHDTQRLSHRIKFCMQRSLIVWSSQTHRWFTLEIYIVPLKLMELRVCLRSSICLSIFRSISGIPFI